MTWLSHVQKRCDYYFDWKLFFYKKRWTMQFIFSITILNKWFGVSAVSFIYLCELYGKLCVKTEQLIVYLMLINTKREIERVNVIGIKSSTLLIKKATLWQYGMKNYHSNDVRTMHIKNLWLQSVSLSLSVSSPSHFFPFPWR